MPFRKTQYNDLRIKTQQRSHINQTHINDHKSQIHRLIKKKQKSQIHRECRSRFEVEKKWQQMKRECGRSGEKMSRSRGETMKLRPSEGGDREWERDLLLFYWKTKLKTIKLWYLVFIEPFLETKQSWNDTQIHQKIQKIKCQ